MWRTLLLIPPVLFPSWRFFKSIEPSPRVQWAFTSGPGDELRAWREFRMRPARIPPLRVIRRLFWNAPWNETLFLVSCAERIHQQPNPHAVAEIRNRVAVEIMKGAPVTRARCFRFRLVFLHRDRGRLIEEVVFVSDEYEVAAGPSS